METRFIECQMWPHKRARRLAPRTSCLSLPPLPPSLPNGEEKITIIKSPARCSPLLLSAQKYCCLWFPTQHLKETMTQLNASVLLKRYVNSISRRKGKDEELGLWKTKKLAGIAAPMMNIRYISGGYIIDHTVSLLLSTECVLFCCSQILYFFMTFWEQDPPQVFIVFMTCPSNTSTCTHIKTQSSLEGTLDRMAIWSIASYSDRNMPALLS